MAATVKRWWLEMVGGGASTITLGRRVKASTYATPPQRSNTPPLRSDVHPLTLADPAPTEHYVYIPSGPQRATTWPRDDEPRWKEQQEPPPWDGKDLSVGEEL